ncbi:EDC4 [Mytilus coruscus]|uniref:EDC4 n=1 Tax=Mytilus coruscus TaxID=42192 RepID=A0A6J8CDA6_MYTCO|nr:unnamed protein product [Mytilus coruscus]CAC5393443.1 EDC4 [Mytilus coruscus]
MVDRKAGPRCVREIVRETVDRKALSQLQDNIQNILNALESQNGVIERLQEQLADQQEKQNELQRQQIEIEQLRHMSQQPQPNIEEHLGKLEGIVTSRVERMFTQHAQKENQRINQIMQQSETREKQRHERLQHTLVQTLQKSVASNVEDQVRDEMRNTVLPAVTRSLEPVKEQLHQELAQKLTATDSLLKDNIGKMIRSRQTTEAIGLAAGNALQTPIQAAYREAFQNIVIPNFDRATQNMFQQVNEAFTKGTKEYIRTLETHLDVIKQKHTEARDPIVAQMRKLADSFQSSSETIKAQVTASIQSQVQNEMQNSFLSLQETLIRAVRQAVKDEVNTAVQEQGATISSNVLDAMRSGAVTPVPTSPDPQQARTHIMQLLRQGQLNAAFQQALSAANLELVVFVCETVNPAQIFNQTPCPLEQPVLLSLIQQLSADIGQNTELKHKYLEESVMNLDLTNKITQEHMRGVLYSLIQKLKNYISQHPNDKTYIRTLETHLDVIKQKHTEARDPIVAQMRKLADSFQSSSETIKAQVTASIQSQVQNEMQNSFLSLQETLIRAVRQAVKDEVNTAVQEQGATISSNVLDAMRSGAVTPVPTSPDPQQARTHIMQLLRQGQLNAAFQQALSAANLELVVFVCETLSADIGQNTELKHKYLEESVMNLDLTNKITQEHMRGVLYSLIQKLKNYISQHPNDKTCRHLKMLQMASESLLK